MGDVIHFGGGKMEGELKKTFSCVIDGVEFIWRQVTRKEWKTLRDSDVCPMENEEKLVNLCLISSSDPASLSDAAGIVSTLADCIMSTSGFVDDVEIVCCDNGISH